MEQGLGANLLGDIFLLPGKKTLFKTSNYQKPRFRSGRSCPFPTSGPMYVRIDKHTCTHAQKTVSSNTGDRDSQVLHAKNPGPPFGASAPRSQLESAPTPLTAAPSSQASWAAEGGRKKGASMEGPRSGA